MRDLHPQLEVIRVEIRHNQARAHELAARLEEADWRAKPKPNRWSVSECISHLNLTSTAMVDNISTAAAGQERADPPRRYRRDAMGWLLCRTMEPPVRKRFPTTAPFLPEPASVEAKATTMSEFDIRHSEQLTVLESLDGMRLGRIKVESPFNPKIRYNAYSAFKILTAHERRHLWQAEQIFAPS